jgi:quinol monooxygenase YgiN
MAGFVQIIEITTSRIDEVQELGDDFQSSRGPDQDGNFVRAIVVADRDRPGVYMNIVHFASYEAAMENSKRPDTQKFAERLAELCDAPPKFLNLDVRQIWEP